MNALIFSAVSGVIMMFSSFLLTSRSAVRILAYFLLAAVIVVNVLEIKDVSLFNIDTRGMMVFDRFALLFTLIANISTFAFFFYQQKIWRK